MMHSSKILRALSAVLTMMLAASLPIIVHAESGNPFEDPAAQADTYNPFVDAANSATPNPGATPIPDAAAPASGATDSAAFSFDTGSQAQEGANLFANTPAPVTTANPGIGSTAVSGYNPFDPNSAPQAAVPTAMIMFVSASTVKIRRSANDNAGVLATAAFGQQLSVTATQGEWAQIANVKGRAGYCQLSALTSTDPNTMAKTMYAQLKRVPFYRMPARNAGKLRWLSQGDTVTVTAISSDGLWSRATDGSNYGFIPTIYLDDAPSAQGTPMWCADGATAVLVNPENWTEITKLSFGQPVAVVGYVSNNTIAKIRSGKGYVAYCAAGALTAADPATMNTPVYTQVGGKLLFSSADSNSKARQIGKNVRMTLLGVDSSQYWALVKFNGRKYYTPYVLVGQTRLGTANRVVVTMQETPLYRSATESMGALQANTRLYLTGFSGTAAQVSTIPDGVTAVSSGFVMISDLRGE